MNARILSCAVLGLASVSLVACGARVDDSATEQEPWTPHRHGPPSTGNGSTGSTTPAVDPNLDRPLAQNECAAGSARRVFVTAGSFKGDLKSIGGGKDGFDGADKLCMQEAARAKLCGSFKAFIGGMRNGSVLPPAHRIADVGPWFNMDGERVFADRASLDRGAEHGLNVNVLGHRSSVSAAWIGFSKTTGIDAGSCKGDGSSESWTSNSPSDRGHLGVPILASSWSDMPAQVFGTSTHACDAEIPLFCFEQ